MRRFVVICIILIGAAIFYAGWLSHVEAVNAKIKREKESLADLDVGGARPPLWASTENCREPNPIEQNQNRLALNVIEVFDGSRLNDLQAAAVKHFAHPWMQRRATSRDNTSIPCAPADLHSSVATAAIKAGVFDAPFLYASGIALAEQVGPRDTKIIDAIARSAFRDSEIPDDPFGTDLRPYARLVLAQFGKAASEKWAKDALAQISASNQMGTGAAQIAIAGGLAEAFTVVEKLMNQILSDTPKNKPIPRLSRNRIYELAFAMGMAGEAARPHSSPLVELLDRKVESWAPPFGMIVLPPARMCPVALRIGGAIATAALEKDFCVSMPKAFEQ